MTRCVDFAFQLFCNYGSLVYVNLKLSSVFEHETLQLLFLVNIQKLQRLFSTKNTFRINKFVLHKKRIETSTFNSFECLNS